LWINGLRVVVAGLLVAGIGQVLRYRAPAVVTPPGNTASASVAAPVDRRANTGAWPADRGGGSPGAGAGGGAGALPAALAAGATGSAGAAGLPVPVALTPRPGRYRYRVDGKPGAGLVSPPVTIGAGAARVTETIPAATGAQVETVNWSSAGRTVVATTFADGFVCRWSTPLLSVRSALAPGETWQTTGSCGTNAHGTLRWSEQVKVDGFAHAVVGGQVVAVWAIERHQIRTVQSPHGSVTTDTQISELFAPSLGLVVYRVARTIRPESDGTVTTTTATTELMDVAPQ
jgi:hypothetical protein